MALADIDVQLSIEVATDVETATIIDGSDYAAAGVTRSDVRVFVNAYKVSHGGTQTVLSLTSDQSDPAADARWTWDYEADGYHRFYYVAIPAYAGGTTYAIYDAVYDSATDVVYRSKSNGNVGNSLSNTVYWEVISDPASLANNFGENNESENIKSLIYLRVLRSLSQRAFSLMIGENCGCTDCEDDIIPQYNLFRFWLDCAEVADTRSEVLDGELICRRIESRFLTNC